MAKLETLADEANQRAQIAQAEYHRQKNLGQEEAAARANIQWIKLAAVAQSSRATLVAAQEVQADLEPVVTLSVTSCSTLEKILMETTVKVWVRNSDIVTRQLTDLNAKLHKIAITLLNTPRKSAEKKTLFEKFNQVDSIITEQRRVEQCLSVDTAHTKSVGDLKTMNKELCDLHEEFLSVPRKERKNIQAAVEEVEAAIDMKRNESRFIPPDDQVYTFTWVQDGEVPLILTGDITGVKVEHIEPRADLSLGNIIGWTIFCINDVNVLRGDEDEPWSVEAVSQQLNTRDRPLTLTFVSDPNDVDLVTLTTPGDSLDCSVAG